MSDGMPSVFFAWDYIQFARGSFSRNLRLFIILVLIGHASEFF